MLPGSQVKGKVMVIQASSTTGKINVRQPKKKKAVWGVICYTECKKEAMVNEVMRLVHRKNAKLSF